jgi:hypothetical protein
MSKEPTSQKESPVKKSYLFKLFPDLPTPPECGQTESYLISDFADSGEAIAAYSLYWDYLILTRCKKMDEARAISLPKSITPLNLTLSPSRHHSAVVTCGNEVIKTFYSDLTLEE